MFQNIDCDWFDVRFTRVLPGGGEDSDCAKGGQKSAMGGGSDPGGASGTLSIT